MNSTREVLAPRRRHAWIPPVLVGAATVCIVIPYFMVMDAFERRKERSRE